MSEPLLHIVNVEKSDQELQIVETLRQQSGAGLNMFVFS